MLLTHVERSPVPARLAYLKWRLQFLADQGVQGSAILLDERSGSTMAEAVNTLALMKANG